MPKRKHSQEDLDRIQRKIKKLEKKLKKRLNSVSSDTSSELEEVLPLADYGAGIYHFVFLTAYYCVTLAVVWTVSTHVKYV